MHIDTNCERKQPARGRLPWASPIISILSQPYHVLIFIHIYIHCEGKQPAWGGLHMPGHYLSIHVNTYLNHVQTSSLLGAACLGQPYPGPMYMHPCIQIGAASSRPGAGCLGPIISLYMCIHTKWKSKRLAWGGGGFPGAALPQAAGLGVGCLGQPHYISKCLHTYIWNGTAISLPGAPAWGDLAMSLYECICKSEYTRFPCVVGCLMSESRNTRKFPAFCDVS